MQHFMLTYCIYRFSKILVTDIELILIRLAEGDYLEEVHLVQCSQVAFLTR